jgi:hypothetical protein
LNYDKDIQVNLHKNSLKRRRKIMKKYLKTNGTKLRGKKWQKFLAVASLVGLTTQLTLIVSPLSLPTIIPYTVQSDKASITLDATINSTIEWLKTDELKVESRTSISFSKGTPIATNLGTSVAALCQAHNLPSPCPNLFDVANYLFYPLEKIQTAYIELAGNSSNSGNSESSVPQPRDRTPLEEGTYRLVKSQRR